MGTEIIGEVDVKIQDQTTEIIDLHLSQLIQDLTIVVDTAIDDTSINVNADALPVAGRIVCLKEDGRFYQGTILAVVDNTGGNYDLTLDTPLDYAYTTAGGCSERSINLAVNGSVTPQIFSLSPIGLGADVKWDITRILGSILDEVAMDDAKFGGISALTNGVVFRKKDGIYKNIFNVKSNGDLAAHMYDVTYADKAAAGTYGLRFRKSFAGQDKAGVTIRLEADTEDEFQCIISDNLSALTDFQIIAQGHVVEGD